MATRTACLYHHCLVFHALVAALANCIILSLLAQELDVWIMTSQTRELLFALLKTPALGQINRLVPHIPGVSPIRRTASGIRLPVASPTLVIDCGGPVPRWVVDLVFAPARLYMRFAWPMANLAIHAWLSRHNRPTRRHLRHPG